MAHANDDGEEYEQMPAYVKDLFWNFKIHDNLWLRIPKNFEVGVLSSYVERLFSKHVLGNEKALEGYAGSLISSTSPIPEGGLMKPFTAFVSTALNYDFFRKRNIIPVAEHRTDLELRNTERASRLGRWHSFFPRRLALIRRR